jgi:TolB protein
MHQSLFAFLLALIPFACCSSEEIRVHLSNETALQPIYTGKLQSQQAAFDSSYLQQLETVLEYDLNHEGHLQVCQRTPEKERLLQLKENSAAFDIVSWKQMGIPYAIRWQISQRTLSLSLFTAKTGSIKSFTDLQLTGDLSVDRRQVHKLADAISRALFNKEGVANTRILFAYQIKNPRPDGKEWVSEIWECDWDGANLRQITHENSYCVTPILIPHSPRFSNDRFLYVSYKMGQPKIYIASLKEGHGERLIELQGNQLLPAVSPQRDKIAFICDAAGRTDLFLQPFHSDTRELGKPIQLYSHPRSTQASPTFSPDGSQLAFVSDKDGGVRIYVIPAVASSKRSNARMISKINRENSCPSWSPDGTKLAYSAKTNGIRQIWIYDFASDEESQLTFGNGNKENPCWAPDSQHIVFNSTDNDSSELYVVNLNQPDVLKISRGPGKKQYPTWGAR